MIGALTAVGIALAGEAPSEPAPEPRPTAQLDGMQMAKAGIVVGAAGEVAFLAGVAMLIAAAGDMEGRGRDEAVQAAGLTFALAGNLAIRAGSPMMAAGGLRARRTLADRGKVVSAVPAQVSLGLAAGSLVAGTANAILITGTSPYYLDTVFTLVAVDSALMLGAYGMAGLQLHLDARGDRPLGASVNMAPLPIPGGGGMVVALRW
jgi:hypothetical protein